MNWHISVQANPASKSELSLFVSEGDILELARLMSLGAEVLEVRIIGNARLRAAFVNGDLVKDYPDLEHWYLPDEDSKVWAQKCWNWKNVHFAPDYNCPD